MAAMTKTRSILVIDRDLGLAETIRQVVGSAARVNHAACRAEGLDLMLASRPEIVVIGVVGELDSRAAAIELYRELREGWISHHASVLIVDPLPGNGRRILSSENLSSAIGDWPIVTGAPARVLNDRQYPSEIGRIIKEQLQVRENAFRKAMLDPDRFCLVWEQIPGPGAFERRQETVLENARRAARNGGVCAISVTDNPGGNPAIATDVLCAEIRKIGIEPLVHIAFRDRSRNQAESLLFQLAALDINNVLILTGDYPSALGFTGKSKPVFDLDSVNGLRLVAEMNRGREREILRKPVRLAATDFFAGVAFSPFKQMEAEAMGQFFKMEQKIAAGADFAITQVGYDARKLQEFLMWLNAGNRPIPALAGIYVLSYPVAEAMHANHVPGCVVTDELLRRITAEAESGDKGRQARLDRAARMFAVVKGMGYKGAYLSGQGLTFEDVEYVRAEGERLAGDWIELTREFDYPQPNGFYYFDRDPKTGLNRERRAARTQAPVQPPVYLLSRVFHRLVFDPGGPLFGLMRALMRLIARSPMLARMLHFFERESKSLLYHCKDCGDCALFDVAYLCPVSQCPKDQRNAPCGGSFEGWCEVYPNEKQCIWVRAYLRLKAHGADDQIGRAMVAPCDWRLWQTSSWINYFLGRDHSAKKTGHYDQV